jgi:IS605 OrfB family transposase
MERQRRRRRFKEKLKTLRQKINSFGNQLTNPPAINMNVIDTHSWFDIKKSNQTRLFDLNVTEPDLLETDGYFTKKLEIYPTNRQKFILLKWMDAYIKMYNATTNYFKTCRFRKERVVFNITKLKKIMLPQKNLIADKFYINKDEFPPIEGEDIVKTKNISLDRHLLDYAINDSLKRYESCLTNFRNGNIRHFRLRYLKHTKSNKIIKIEGRAFSPNANSFFTRALGKKVICEDKDLKYSKHIITTSTVKYDKKTDKFTLLIKYEQPKLEATEKYIGREETISLDPGIRTFLTGYSSNGIVEIGTKIQQKIKQKIRQIDNINNNPELSKKQKDRAISKRYDLIKNMVNDVHWKTADYLTKNFKTIVIGNFSTKTIGERDDVNDMTKRIGNMFSFYQFKEKLKYKCFKTGTNYKHIDEAFTTKCCSRCGYFNEGMRDERRYECPQCGLDIGRDINGAKNILMLSI